MFADLLNKVVGRKGFLLSVVLVFFSLTGCQKRTRQAGEVVSVKDFGAVGNGVADDTAAINAAIVAAEGKTLIVPPGNYMVSSMLSIQTSDVRMVGQAGATIKAA